MVINAFTDVKPLDNTIEPTEIFDTTVLLAFKVVILPFALVKPVMFIVPNDPFVKIKFVIVLFVISSFVARILALVNPVLKFNEELEIFVDI